MPHSEFVEACVEATEAMSVIGEQLRDDSDALNPQEVQAFMIVCFAVGYVQQALGDDSDDGNPYRYDDDHKFT